MCRPVQSIGNLRSNDLSMAVLNGYTQLASPIAWSLDPYPESSCETCSKRFSEHWGC